ncbi:G-protein coupled receptor daf-37 [Lepeophtheirus salmonis]|uniref:G-protein coupled receptor daf-37 n=1 Tax=Lepeophtheirus salmonis TaxID=72036 RepID=UPI003AF35D7D
MLVVYLKRRILFLVESDEHTLKGGESGMGLSNNYSRDYNISNNCPTFTLDDKIFSNTFRLWVEYRFQTCIAVLGILINLFSSYVITRKEMRNSFNLLLIFLAVFDSTFLITALSKTFREPLSASCGGVYLEIFAYGLYPLYKISMSGSIFMTVAISGERYFAIHYPLDYSRSMNEANAVRNRWIKYVIPVIFLSILFNSSSFFEITVSQRNATSKPHMSVTPLRKNVFYINYNYWSRLILHGVLPLFMLFYFNFKIFYDIRERRRRRQMRLNATHITLKNNQIRQQQQKQQLQQLHQQASHVLNTETNITKRGSQSTQKIFSADGSRRIEDSLAVIFIGFTFVFCICHTPRILLNIYEILFLERLTSCSSAGKEGLYPWTYTAIRLSHFLLVANSALNMLVYCFLSSKFRKECKTLFRNMCRKQI